MYYPYDEGGMFLELIKTFVKLLIPIVVNLNGDQLYIEGVSKG